MGLRRLRAPCHGLTRGYSFERKVARMLNIVLVEPEIPQNTGNVARTCACIGARLHLVEPMGFAVTQRNLARAGCDYWDDVDIVRWSCADEFFEVHAADELHLFTGMCSAASPMFRTVRTLGWCSGAKAAGSMRPLCSASSQPACASLCALACAA